MRTWLIQQRTLPRGILFVRAPRLQEDGLRWAPSTVYPAVLEDDTPVPRRVGQHNFSIIGPGLLLLPTAERLRNHFLATETIAGRCYRISFDHDFPPPWVVDGWRNDGSVLGLILQSISKETMVGALILVKRIDDSAIMGTYQCRVEVFPVDDSHLPTAVDAQISREDQLWIVS
jgi:hypothetical protein